MSTWLETAEPGWTPLDRPHPFADRNFVSGDDGSRFELRYFSGADSAIFAKVVFGSAALGPPGHVHGGAIAALLDEVIGGAAWHAGHEVFAVRLETDFKQMIPLLEPVVVRAAVERVQGRKVWGVGEVRSPDECTLYARGRVLLVGLLTPLAGS